ncbi:MAG: hypothetical protein HRT74_14435, partial [Flavobacteriales bacterium]|nr:hypothetical protein [Flavobacteriales bacterium]
EKLRISRDLHDHIGAELTLIKSKADVLAYQQEDEQLKIKLNQLSEWSAGAIEELRKTIWATNQPEIKIGDFANEVEMYMTRFEGNHEVKCHQRGLLLPSDIALGAFRICQEAIQNAFKYAQDDIEVTVGFDHGQLLIEVMDRGPGFEENENGYGLNNMKSRAEDLGGQLTIKPRHPGTSVQVKIPLPSSN